ncbi:MAG: tetratricopeptide repeat protein [Oscillatoria princeps RMCB-10]|jgi:tetratricopeptide (TPR) repeat protein|nr:tetratricopeptide repeat protein [Oscillatoria princeps RMCB-10]
MAQQDGQKQKGRKLDFDTGKVNAELLVRALLSLKSGELNSRKDSARLIKAVKLDWNSDAKQLQVTAELRHLVELAEKCGHPIQDSEALRNALRCLFELGIAEDKRLETSSTTKTSSSKWVFTLKLPSTDGQEALDRLFKPGGEWDRRRSPQQPKSQTPQPAAPEPPAPPSNKPHEREKSVVGEMPEIAAINPEKPSENIPESEFISFIGEAPAPAPPAPPCENIPESGAAAFVGREEELSELHRLLQENERVAIAGMPGAGATELAVQYARKYLAEYAGGVCWVPVGDRDTGIAIVEFSRRKFGFNPPDDLNGDLLRQVAFCWDHWHAGQVLLVWDNVSDCALVKPYLPPVPSRFKVLLVTRESLSVPVVRLDLDALKPLAGMQLLESLMGREWLKREPRIARNLCKWLGYLPLGLQLVGRYLAQDETLSLETILSRLQQQELAGAAQLPVAHVFELIWQTLDENAQKLACLLSLFPSLPSWSIVEHICRHMAAHEENFNPETLEQSRLTLEHRHQLQRQHEGIYQLHPIIRQLFEEKLITPISPVTTALLNAFVSGMIEVVAAAGEAGAAAAVSWISADVLALINGLINLASLHYNRTHYASAEPLYLQALELTRRLLGEEHLNVAFTLNSVAELYHTQGRYAEAEPLYRQALEVWRRRHGEEHPDVATALNNLGNLCDAQGRYGEAESLYLQALEVWRRLQGEEHPYMAESLSNLATLYDAQGRGAEAEPLYRQALELRQRLLGEEHPDVGTSLNNLGNFYSSQGRYAEAEPLLLGALELWRRRHGEDHPNVATCLNNLASLYSAQGRGAKAEPLYRQALELLRSRHGGEHPDVAITLNNLAAFYCAQGRYGEAETLLLQAVELWGHRHGEDRPHRAITLNNLAEFYCAQGRYAEAEPLLLEAVDLWRSLHGEEGAGVAESLNTLANIFCAQGRYAEAEPLYRQVLELWRRRLGDEHLVVAESLNNLANVCYCEERYEEAEPLYRQALELRRRWLGEEHPDVAESLNSLGNLYYSQECYAEAEPLYRQALEICARGLGAEHPLTVTVGENLERLELSR